MRRILLAAAAALALGACGQMGSGPPLPPPQDGVTAPTKLEPPEGQVKTANVTNEFRQQVTAYLGQQLDQIQSNYAQGMAAPEGFADEIAPMQASSDHRWRVRLLGGRQYAVLGACDDDCTNVDIELVDSRGGVVQSDVLPDDYPVVIYQPAADGDYYVRLMMRACTTQPCFAGARVVVAPAGG